MKTTCIVCGARIAPWLQMPIDQKTLKRTDYGNVYKCTECGHGTVNPLPAPEKIAAFYDLEKYYTQGLSHFSELPPKFHDRVLTKLAWIFDNGVNFDEKLHSEKMPPNSVICEIGCGHAEKLLAFKANGHKVIGVDPDQKAAIIAKKNGIEVLIGTAENLPEHFDDNSIDMIIMSHSLEHCINPILAIKNVGKALRPGGVFVCEVPNAESTHFIWNNICSEMFDAPRHLHFFNPESLRKSIELSELKVETLEYCGFTRHLSQNWRKVESDIHKNVKDIKQTQVPAKHTFFRSLLLWCATFIAPPNKKYDSVRIISRKPLQA